MPEVLLKFERENREGVVAVGSYLIDAARRLGIALEDPSDASEAGHTCIVEVGSGAELLSHQTRAEREHFERHGRKSNERLACQTKIVKPGEVIIMTEAKKTETAEKESPDETKDRFRKEFEDLPLEKKIASLLQFELIAFGETISFVFNSPYKVFDKVMDVMAEFGMKKDEDAKNAGRPDEHKQNAGGKSGRHGKPKGEAHGGADAPAAG